MNLLDGDLYSLHTVVGLFWSIAIVYLLYTARGVAISSSKWLLPVTTGLVYLSIPAVAAQVDALTVLAGGVQTLDGHIGYGSAHITEFAEALGPDGRWQYAYFQLGLDTLAPPAFAGFVLNVGRATISYPMIRRLLTVLVSIYFFSVLIANALMPVYMLAYPNEGGVYSLLYAVLPVLDGVKYGCHGVLWLLVFGAWLYWCSQFLYTRLSNQKTATIEGGTE
ncbi:MAG: hypothetical protein ABJ013_13910 [Halioglobus sp.]